MLTSQLLNMFGRSPIQPLKKHMAKAYAAVKMLNPFVDAVMNQAWDEAAILRDKIAALEQEADALKKDLRLHLPKGLFLPVPRTDVLELLTMQDRLANKAKDISGIILGRQMIFPSEIARDFKVLLVRCIDAAEQAFKAINELDELLEAGFRGNEVKVTENMILELDKIEHDTDDMQVSLRKHLFALEQTLPPIDVVFFYKVIEWTGDLADRSQMIGGHLLLLLAR